MEQTLNERRQLLQSTIFAHPAARHFNPYSQAVLRQLSRCHTARIGVHQYQCDNKSCGPALGWTTYFHVVFTLPQELRSLFMGNRILLFGLLFEASRHTLLTLAKDVKYIGATPGIVSILHTHSLSRAKQSGGKT